MWYVEMGGSKNNFFKRNILVGKDDIEKVRCDFDNTDVYCTPYLYSCESPEGVKNLDRNECDKISDFYLDFDKELESDEDFNCIREDALKSIIYMYAIFNIPKENIQIFFSGSKGVHLVVPKEIMGIKPYKYINRVFKSIAEEIYEYTPNKTIDRKIYDNKRLFRLENSINSKSGLFKVPISYMELKWCSLEEIRNIAKSKREVKLYSSKMIPKAELFYNKYLTEWEKKINKPKPRTTDGVVNFKKLNKFPPCIEHVMDSDVPKGQRNNTAIALASFLIGQKYEENEIKDIMTSWACAKCNPPMDEGEISVTISSALSHGYKFGCSTLKIVSTCDKSKCPFFK